jgi:hypothetical protein
MTIQPYHRYWNRPPVPNSSSDDVDRIGGQKDKLIGLLQERYEYTREQAEQQMERRLQVRRQDRWGYCQYVGQGTGVRRDCSSAGERGGTRYR